MAVYKIFPTKDATIYSLYPSKNTGLDEIVEATLTAFAYSDPNPQTSRFLINFQESEIDDILQNKIGISSSAQLLDNNLWKEVPVKTGDVLFFPGWINHRTQENTTNEERIVMTYNIDANPTL